MIQPLTIGEPLIHTLYAENETAFPAGESDLILNLSRSTPITAEGFYLAPFHSAIFHHTKLEIPGRALVIPDFNIISRNTSFESIRGNWKSVWELLPEERNRDVEYYKSPAIRVGGDTNLTYCFGEAQLPAGLHRKHGEKDFDELHLQICGHGTIQLFRENDPFTLYESLPLSPGITNTPIWDKKGNYPWHRYYSETRCLFLVIEIDR